MRVVDCIPLKLSTLPIADGHLMVIVVRIETLAWRGSELPEYK